MADNESVDPLAAFDALLRAELAVQPAPDFLPRVRERIRTEPTPSRWPSLWIVAPLAAAAAVVLAAGLAYWTANGTSPTAPTPPAVTVSSVAAHANVASSTAPPSRFALRRASRVPNTAPSTEVIVDPRQREALLAFVHLANRGELTDESFTLTTPSPAGIEEQVKMIAVDPVAVSPITARGVLPLELERK